MKEIILGVLVLLVVLFLAVGFTPGGEKSLTNSEPTSQPAPSNGGGFNLN